MKKFSAIVLSFVMSLNLMVPAIAAGTDYDFTILADGSSSATVDVSDTVTISLVMENSNGDAYDLYNMQDYICFDTSYLSYVEGSASVYQASSDGIPYDLFSASAIDLNQGTIDRVFVNRSANTAYAVGAGEEIEVLTFELKALKAGTTTISHDTVEMLSSSGTKLSVDESTAKVTISSSGSSGGSSSGGSSSSSSDTYYDIDISVGSNGSISPDIDEIEEDSDQTFYFAPDDGYEVGDVIVDGVSVGAVDSYTFEDVSEEHTLEVVFVESEINEELESSPEISDDTVFSDVSESDWFYTSVMNALENGWVSGTSETTFDPYMSTSRAMIVSILYRMEGASADVSDLSFTDVASDAWYAEGIAWAAVNGIVSGYSAEIFAPNDPITREQMAAIFYRYANYKGYDMSTTTSLDTFIDGDTTSEYAMTSMSWAVANGLFTGREDGTLDPRSGATRAEVTVVLGKFAKL